MSEIERARARAQASREWLLSDLERVSPEAMNRGAKPGAVTAGSTALHTAGMDLMLAAGIRPDLVDDTTRDAWQIARRGYWRELGKEVPSDVSKAEVSDVLRTAREALDRAVSASVEAREDGIDVEAGLAALSVEGEPVEILHEATHLSASEEASIVDALDTVAEHDQYHRGQITLLRFLAADDT
jgi:uncharacterized damage-inducible protein DinB